MSQRTKLVGLSISQSLVLTWFRNLAWKKTRAVFLNVWFNESLNQIIQGFFRKMKISGPHSKTTESRFQVWTSGISIVNKLSRWIVCLWCWLLIISPDQLHPFTFGLLRLRLSLGNHLFLCSPPLCLPLPSRETTQTWSQKTTSFQFACASCQRQPASALHFSSSNCFCWQLVPISTLFPSPRTSRRYPSEQQHLLKSGLQSHWTLLSVPEVPAPARQLPHPSQRFKFLLQVSGI